MDKRQIRKEFKSRQTPKGIFAIRCAASGEVWVSSSRNLAASRTGSWFMLRNGMHHNKRLQAAWNAHGEQAFEFDILETFADDLSPVLLKDSLRDRQKYWEKELGAAMV